MALTVIHLITVVPTRGICECFICTPKEPGVVCQIIDIWIAAETIGETQVARIAAPGMVPL
jgi:hypothetical protein